MLRQTNEWDEFFSEAASYFETQQRRVGVEFNLDECQHYHYDQDTGTFTFSSDGIVRIVADMHAVGSTSVETGTWLWAWDNPSILPAVKHRVGEVRRLGEQRRYAALAMPACRGDDEHGWQMTVIAMYVLQAEVAYRAPQRGGSLFIVLSSLRWAA